MSSPLIPTMRYRDARKMLDWLCDTFGFARKAVYDGDDGSVMHAELTLGGGMIMIGTARDDEFSKLQRPPETSTPVTQSVYIVVPDVDAIYKAARANGASIVMEIADKDYGGREFTCRDPEGQLWSIGTYDPWK